MGLFFCIQKDQWVAQTFTPEDMKALEKCATFQEVKTLLGKYGFLKSGDERFAIYRYDATIQRAAVRLAFKASEAGFDLNKVSALGLWVVPTPKMRRSLAAAADGRGFFMATKKVDRFIQ